MSALAIPPVYGKREVTENASGSHGVLLVAPSRRHLFVVPDHYVPSPQHTGRSLASISRRRSPKEMRDMEANKNDVQNVQAIPEIEIFPAPGLTWQRLLAATILAVILGVVLGLLLRNESASAYQTIQVAAGESVWSIAATVAAESEIAEVVSEIKQINSLESSVLEVGQTLLVPAK